MMRRRALMAVKGSEEPNGLSPSASAGKGSSVASISSDGLLYIDSFIAMPQNAILAYFKRPLTLKNGDSLAIKIVRKSGTLSPRYNYVDVYINDTALISNKLFDGGANTTFNQTQIISADLSAECLQIAGRSQNQTGSGYSAEIQISINGERVI